MQQNNRQLSAQEVHELKLTCLPNFGMQHQQVAGGFRVTGVIVWSRGGNIVAQQQDEAVASDVSEVLDLVQLYHRTGTFDTAASSLEDLREQYEATQTRAVPSKPVGSDEEESE